jgi:ketosteroid isomerase-like protein
MPAPDRAHIQAANDATYDAWNAHDPDAVAAIFAEHAVMVDHDVNFWDVPSLLAQLSS